MACWGQSWEASLKGMRGTGVCVASHRALQMVQPPGIQRGRSTFVCTGRPGRGIGFVALRLFSTQVAKTRVEVDPDMPAMAKNALLILAASIMLAGCGVRGPVTMPKSDPNAPPTPEANATSESGQGKPENTAAKPHQGFILDGLLR